MASSILRKNIEALSDSEVSTLRVAYQKMMSILDNRGYNYFAGLHGVPGQFCWHHRRTRLSTLNASLFLPWHRAYLLHFEQALRDQDATVSLPWWDWTSHESHTTGIPTAFAAATIVGNPNPLYSGRIFAPTAIPPVDKMTVRDPDAPNKLPLASKVDNLKMRRQFEDFSAAIEDIHDGVHGWTSGDMGNVSFAAYDPIFWSHHCMIDRLWYLWQLENGVNNIPHQYLPMVLEPFPLTVEEVLNVKSLGYDYAVSSLLIK